MSSIDQMHLENHKITELSNVFLYLIKDRTMCDTRIACDIFYDYIERVRSHLDTVETQYYQKLLSNSDQKIKNTADRFMSGSQEIKKIFNDYVNQWGDKRNRTLVVKSHEDFIQDTEEMFRLILDLLQRETEHLYPLVRKFLDGKKAA